MTKTTILTYLKLGAAAVGVAGAQLGHLTPDAANILEALIFALGGAHIAQALASRPVMRAEDIAKSVLGAVDKLRADAPSAGK